MKKLLLLLLMTNMGFGQMRTVQIKLVDPNVGTAHYYNLDGMSVSNDVELNQIMLNHGVYNYYDGNGWNFDGQDEYKKLMDCNGCNIEQLVSDLTAYSSVIAKAHISPEPVTFSDMVWIKQITSNSFSITGTDANNIIITDNTVVNQIFQTRSVYNGASGSVWNHFLCDCNVGDLVADLLANNIINPNTINSDNETIHDSYYYEPVAFLLANKYFKNNIAKVYPNPFTTTFTIDSKEKINRYAIYDITGKQLVNTNSKSELNALSLNLKSGIYLLQLETETGAISNQKLIRQ
jgi:hypothetical protein